MYAIVNVVYGIPLHDNNTLDAMLDKEWSDELGSAIDEEYPGILGFYSGSSNCVPTAFGVLIDTFDEACHHVDLSSIRFQPDVTQIKQYDEEWAALPKTLQTEITSKFGKPRVFMLWTTS